MDSIEALQPGWTLNQLELESAWIDARLRKRYDAPFSTPYPIAVLGWLTAIVTNAVMLRRGVNSQDEQYTNISEREKTAREEIKEAADSEKGLFDLPLRADTNKTGITKNAPLCYTETSPYVNIDIQADIGRQEDADRYGTRG